MDKKNKKNSPAKYLPAIIACAIVLAFYIILIISIFMFPVFPVWAIVVLFVSPVIIGIIWALVERILELKSGEEDEAKKY